MSEEKATQTPKMSLFRTFFAVSWHARDRMEQLEADLKPIWTSVISLFPGDPEKDDPRPYLLSQCEEETPLFVKNNQLMVAATTACLFSALAAESYINWYSSTRLPRKQSNELDKLSPLGKWLIVPELVKGRGLDTGGQALEMAAEIFKLRNDLVHDKPRPAHLVDPTVDYWEASKKRTVQTRATKARPIETIQELVKELSELDESVDPGWTSQPPLPWEVSS